MNEIVVNIRVNWVLKDDEDIKGLNDMIEEDGIVKTKRALKQYFLEEFEDDENYDLTITRLTIK